MNGLKGKPVDEIIRQFYGSLDSWPAEPDGLNWTRDQVRKVCQHISETGDCLWHAQAVITGNLANCHCAKCMPGPIVARKAVNS